MFEHGNRKVWQLLTLSLAGSHIATNISRLPTSLPAEIRIAFGLLFAPKGRGN
jgi:hypothetical protein